MFRVGVVLSVVTLVVVTKPDMLLTCDEACCGDGICDGLLGGAKLRCGIRGGTGGEKTGAGDFETSLSFI